MKKYFLAFFLMINSAFAMNCDYPAEVLYSCKSEKLEVCISESSKDDVLFRIQVIQPNQEMTFNRRADAVNNSKKLSIVYKEKLLLFTIRSVKFHLNKKNMQATFKVQDFNLGIGDGPHWDASVPLTKLICTDIRNP